MSGKRRKWLPIRAAYALAAAILFIGWGVGATLLAWIVIPIVNWVNRKQSEEERIARAQRIIGWGNHVLLVFARICQQVNWRRSEAHFDFPDGPFMLIGNHPTLIDVCSVTAKHPNVCVLAKPKMIRSIFIGRALRASGHIEAPGRKSGKSFGGANVIAAGVNRLNRGMSLLIFPEGTRSPPGSVGKMTRGAFEIANRANVPIIPLFIRADPPTLHRGMKWYSLPKESSRYSITQLPTVHMDRFDGDSKRAAIHFQELFMSHLLRSQNDPVRAEASEAARNAGATT